MRAQTDPLPRTLGTGPASACSPTSDKGAYILSSLLRILSIATLCFAMTLGVGCGSEAKCMEPCEESSECPRGHICLATQQGDVCAPVECSSCTTACFFGINPNAEFGSTCIWTGCS